MTDGKKYLTENPWRSLKKYTDARIGIGRAGVSQPTSHQLAFQLAHACAKDAVDKPLNWTTVHQQLQGFNIPVIHLGSQAPDRQTYLQRPDLGRRLNTESVTKLSSQGRTVSRKPASKKSVSNKPEICLVIADGLSAPAIENQSVEMIKHLLPDFEKHGYQCPAIYTVSQARVAIGDEISELLQADMLVLLVGERPGLSSPDSLGIYFTYRARLGFHDAQRNCLSNIRPQGLNFAEASRRLMWLMSEAQKLNTSGVTLKDNSQANVSLAEKNGRNFLVE